MSFFKLLFFVVAIAAGIFALYYYQIGPFKNNVAHIDVIKKKYCEEQKSEICDCIVKPLEADLKSRFTADELTAMKEDRVQSAYTFQKSLSVISEQSKACLKRSGNEKLWTQFIKETLQLDNAVTDKVQDLIKQGKTAVDEKLNETKSKKESIDSKY